MRKVVILTALFVAAGAFQAVCIAAQAPSANPEGDWFNGPQAESGVGVAIHIVRRNGTLAATIDVPDQGAANVPVENLKADGSELSFDIPEVAGHYQSRWDPVQHAYVGNFAMPGGGGGPLTFVRGHLPPRKPLAWPEPVTPGLAYSPAPAAHARVGPTLPVGKCINVSNSLEVSSEGDWRTSIRDDDFGIIKAAGFQTVRIPVRWSGHALQTAPYTIDATFLARVHHVVNLATAAGLNVIVNMHNYDALDSAPEANTARFAGIWRQIGASFANAPGNVWFELYNEPHDKFTNANLMHVFMPALAAIRRTNPRRPVLIGGEDWSGINSLATLPMPDDPYVVPTFHYYEPFAFTHQGATWVGPNPPPMGRSYGFASDKVMLDQDLAKVTAFMAKTGRVPVLGEYGAQDDARVPLAQRVRYYHTISSAYASVGVQSCAWGYRRGFRLRDGDHWLPGLVEAIATTKPGAKPSR